MARQTNVQKEQEWREAKRRAGEEFFAKLESVTSLSRTDSSRTPTRSMDAALCSLVPPMPSSDRKSIK